jgi:anti-sigma regulatory factor (Ser/Thr protein kinase)
MQFAGHISLEPTPSEVTRLNAWLDRAFVESRIERSLAADLKLCLNEIVANLISYGLKDRADPFISIDVNLQPGCAKAVIRDNGTYFDIREWPLPRDRDLMSGELGGFGVALIRERASRIDYGREGDFNRLDVVCEG